MFVQGDIELISEGSRAEYYSKFGQNITKTVLDRKKTMENSMCLLNLVPRFLKRLLSVRPLVEQKLFSLNKSYFIHTDKLLTKHNSTLNTGVTVNMRLSHELETVPHKHSS